MKHSFWKRMIVIIGIASFSFTLYATVNTAKAQGPENFALTSWSMHSGATASGGDFSLNTITGQGNAGAISIGGDFSLTSGTFITQPGSGEPEPPKDELIYLPVVRR